MEGCRVVQEPYVRYDDPDAFVFNDLPVSLYFFPQQAPKGVEVKKPVRVKSVLSVRKGTCRDAGIAGLVKLQHLAARSKANAVINIRATWAKERLGDDLSFGCRVLRKRYLLVWEGSMATAPAANQNEGKTQSQERSESGRAKIDKGDIDARLRRLQDLYYKGLISKEEMESMRRKILDEL